MATVSTAADEATGKARAKTGAARRAARAPAAGTAAKERKTLSQRLMRALTGEIKALEKVIAAADAAEEGAPGDGAAFTAGAKARVDAIGNLTRTLEKLMELTRLERQAVKGGAEEESEAERLRAELMKRLRAIDARRGSGRRLFESAAATGIA